MNKNILILCHLAILFIIGCSNPEVTGVKGNNNRNNSTVIGNNNTIAVPNISNDRNKVLSNLSLGISSDFIYDNLGEPLRKNQWDSTTYNNWEFDNVFVCLETEDEKLTHITLIHQNGAEIEIPKTNYIELDLPPLGKLTYGDLLEHESLEKIELGYHRGWITLDITLFAPLSNSEFAEYTFSGKKYGGTTLEQFGVPAEHAWNGNTLYNKPALIKGLKDSLVTSVYYPYHEYDLFVTDKRHIE